MNNRKTAGVRNLQRGVVLLLTAVLLITMLPLAGLAAESLSGMAAGQKPSNVPAFLSSFSAHAESFPTSGYAGDSVKWKFNTRSGELTISGTGEMWDWEDPFEDASEEIAPWLYYYDQIKTITIQSGITILGKYTFAACEMATKVTIPNTVRSINEGAFADCCSLKSIALPNGLYEIGPYVFSYCDALTSVTIPAGVGQIHNMAFFDNEGLQKIFVAADNKVYKDIDGVVFKKSPNSWEEYYYLVIYPGARRDHVYKVPEGTVSIEEKAFYYNNNLRAILFPSTLGKIYEYAFMHNEKLQRIYLPAVLSSVEKSAFEGCSGLEDVYYAGNEWKKGTIGISSYNGYLQNAEWHCEAAPEELLAGWFEDVPKTAYYYQPVHWAAGAGVTSGTSDITFSPDNTCTRGQAVTFLWRANGSEKAADTKNPFTDIKTTDYYYDAVLWAVKNGVTNGMTATTFGPNENCNRGQIVTFLWRAEKEPEATTAVSFEDVDIEAYYYKAVQWAVEQKVTNGMTETTFGPAEKCTRGQSVTFLYRAQKRYTVTFDANGGDALPISTRQLVNGEVYGSMPEASRGGYEFNGWYTDAEGGTLITDKTKVNLAEDQTLYAHWRGRTYYVTFDPNGGETSWNIKDVINGGLYGDMPMPTRDGYGFDGWYTEPGGGVQITDAMTVDLREDQTLYAHWS